MALSQKLLETLKKVTSDSGITILTDNQYRVLDKGFLYHWFQNKDKDLLPFLGSKGFIIANYSMKSDIESGSYSCWALIDSNGSNVVLEGSCDYEYVAYDKIKAYAEKLLNYGPALKIDLNELHKISELVASQITNKTGRELINNEKWDLTDTLHEHIKQLGIEVTDNN